MNNSSHNITGGIDYESIPKVIEIHSGETVASFNIAIFDDNWTEMDEVLSVTIDQNSLPNRVTIAGGGLATITIVDDDDVRGMYNNIM